jgi:hypothetical protein
MIRSHFVRHAPLDTGRETPARVTAIADGEAYRKNRGEFD